MRTDWQLWSCMADWRVAGAVHHGFHCLATPAPWTAGPVPAESFVSHVSNAQLQAAIPQSHQRRAAIPQSRRRRGASPPRRLLALPTHAGAPAPTHVSTLTLESMAFSLHARSSSSLRHLHPAVPPIAIFRAQVETVAVIRSAGTRTFGLNREARRMVSLRIQCVKQTLQEQENGTAPHVSCLFITCHFL